MTDLGYSRTISNILNSDTISNVSLEWDPSEGRQRLEQRNVHGEIAAENFCEKYKVYRFTISRTKQNKPREKNDQTYQKQNSEN